MTLVFSNGEFVVAKGEPTYILKPSPSKCVLGLEIHYFFGLFKCGVLLLFGFDNLQIVIKLSKNIKR